MVAASRYTLGMYIRQRRRVLGLAQRDLALKISYSAQHLNDIERGNRKVTSESIPAIAKALDVQPDVLYYYAGKIPPDYVRYDVTPEHVHAAFRAFMFVLEGSIAARE